MVRALLVALIMAGTPAPACTYLFLPAMHSAICIPRPPVPTFRVKP